MLNLSDFPKDLQDKIEKILVSNEDILFYGSINDPHIIFRGDIDIMQVIKRKDSRESILAEIKDLFRQILKIRDGSYYISEVKMGEDEPIRDEVDRLLKNKKKIVKKNVNAFLERMKQDGKDISKIQKILQLKMNEENYYNLVDEMRSLYVYRWTARDVIDGKADFTLENNELVCKYDVQIFTGFRYLEMSNYIQFPNLVKKKDDNDEEFLKSLRKNIVKQYFSDKNYYKTAKRLLTYYKQKGDDKMVEKIYELINNPVLGNLYILKTACSVLKTVLEFAKKIDMNKIRLNIESLKMNTIYLDEKDRNSYNRELDKLYKTVQRPALLKKIEALKDKFDNQLQAETGKWAKEINFDLAKIVKSFVEN
jgi:hypothetical protein